MKHIVVLSCIDPRFVEKLSLYLQEDRGLDEYDLIVLAGASLGAEQDAWKKMFYDHMDLAIKLHKVTELWVFDHMDCGMYEKVFGIKRDTDRHRHYKELCKLKEQIHAKYPKLKYCGYIMELNGEITTCPCCKCSVESDSESDDESVSSKTLDKPSDYEDKEEESM
jgi:hypothetical protein